MAHIVHPSSPPNQTLPYSSSAMASTEYDAMLQDVANHMSRSELLRRLSTHSSSTSGSSKKGLARITKQSSASNSPNYVQRRRTTGNQTSRPCPRIAQENPHQTREQRLRNYYSSKEPMDFSRPMSWHPGSDNFQAPGQQVPTGEPALKNTIADLENLAVSGTSASSVQQSIQHAFAMGCGYPITAPTTMYGTSPAQVQGFGAPDVNQEPECDSFPIYSVSDQAQYPYMSQTSTYNAYPNAGYQPAQQWPRYASHYAINPQVPQVVPEHPPTQILANISRKAKASSAYQLTRRKSKELVGMGLYDDRGSDLMSSLNPTVNHDPSRDSMGKGLKLEETWQPPVDDEEGEDDDEGYSTEEADDVEEVAPPAIMASTPAEAQTNFYPTTYGDMSNQSFFFNDDEELMNSDQYASYLAYGQALPGGQPKPQPHLNPGMENYLWF